MNKRKNMGADAPDKYREELQMIVEQLRRHSGDECGIFPRHIQ